MNIVSKRLWQSIIQRPMNAALKTQVIDANGGSQSTLGVLSNVPLTIGNYITTADLHVMENPPFSGLLGRPWQRENHINILEKKDGTYLSFGDDQEEAVLIPTATNGSALIDPAILFASTSTQEEELPHARIEEVLLGEEDNVNLLSDSPPESQDALEEYVNEPDTISTQAQNSSDSTDSFDTLPGNPDTDFKMTEYTADDPHWVPLPDGDWHVVSTIQTSQEMITAEIHKEKWKMEPDKIEELTAEDLIMISPDKHQTPFTALWFFKEAQLWVQERTFELYDAVLWMLPQHTIAVTNKQAEDMYSTILKDIRHGLTDPQAKLYQTIRDVDNLSDAECRHKGEVSISSASSQKVTTDLTGVRLFFLPHFELSQAQYVTKYSNAFLGLLPFQRIRRTKEPCCSLGIPLSWKQPGKSGLSLQLEDPPIVQSWQPHQAARPLIVLSGLHLGKYIPFLLDSGAEANCIGLDTWQQLGNTPLMDTTTHIQGINGLTMPALGFVKNLEVWFGPVRTRINAYIVDKLAFPGILGREWQCQYQYQQWEDDQGTHGRIQDDQGAFDFLITTPPKATSMRRIGLAKVSTSQETEIPDSQQDTMQQTQATTPYYEELGEDEEDEPYEEQSQRLESVSRSSDEDKPPDKNNEEAEPGEVPMEPAAARTPSPRDPPQAFYHGTNAWFPPPSLVTDYSLRHLTIMEAQRNQKAVIAHGALRANEWRLFPQETRTILRQPVRQAVYLANNAQFQDIYGRRSDPCTAIVYLLQPIPLPNR